MSRAPWIDAARTELDRWRRDGARWGYRGDTEASVEASVLAALALRATAAAQRRSADQELAVATGRWLAALQATDGGVGVSARLPWPRWPTALAVVLWSTTGGFSQPLERAVEWLLQRRGTTWEPSADSPYGHDVRLAGWPWLEGTHSWLEPTAWALLALRRCGRGEHPRCLEGTALVLDRQVPSGGWNYGNSLVFGTPLRPHPEPTGLALAALAGVTGAAEVQPAVDYLEGALPRLRAGRSLAWGLLGLAAWGRRPPQADAWLEEAAPRALDRGATVEVALLLLASAGAGSRLMGLATPEEER